MGLLDTFTNSITFGDTDRWFDATAVFTGERRDVRDGGDVFSKEEKDRILKVMSDLPGGLQGGAPYAYEITYTTIYGREMHEWYVFPDGSTPDPASLAGTTMEIRYLESRPDLFENKADPRTSTLQDGINAVKGLTELIMSEKRDERERAEKDSKTVRIICPYCGTSSRFVWEEGKLPTCPSCGAVFEADDPKVKKALEEQARLEETRVRAREEAAVESAKTKNKIRRYIVIVAIIIVLAIVLVIIAKLNGGSLNMNGDAAFNFHIS